MRKETAGLEGTLFSLTHVPVSISTGYEVVYLYRLQGDSCDCLLPRRETDIICFHFLCPERGSHHINLPPLATPIQLSGGVHKATGGELVTWVKRADLRALPLSGPLTMKSQRSLPPEVFSHLTAFLMNDDSLIEEQTDVETNVCLTLFTQKSHR